MSIILCRQLQVDTATDPAFFMDMRSQISAFFHAQIPRTGKFDLARESQNEFITATGKALLIVQDFFTDKCGELLVRRLGTLEQIAGGLHAVIQAPLLSFGNRKMLDVVQ